MCPSGPAGDGRNRPRQTRRPVPFSPTPSGFARSVRWTGFLDRLTNKINPLRTAPVNPLAERESALGPLAAATMPAPTASSPAASSKQDAMAKYVKDRGGNTVIRKVRVLYVGLCVGWGERYSCKRSF